MHHKTAYANNERKETCSELQFNFSVKITKITVLKRSLQQPWVFVWENALLSVSWHGDVISGATKLLDYRSKRI